jgi:lipid II:glycine glycyltransferase (peptidoglycan interpeptide bridge formation enzyme)
MKIVELKNAKLIEDFLTTAGATSGSEFLVSKEWADLSKNITNFGVYNNQDELVAIFNLSHQNIKSGLVYYYCPRGPVIIKQDLEVWQFLAAYFKEQGATFWRVEPSKIPADFNFKKTIDLQPRQTLLLDLENDEEELLKQMHPKTRYNIKLAQKKGVVIKRGETEQDFNNFWSLMTTTGERDAFKIHHKEHYHNLATANADFVKLFLAYEGDKCLAAGLFSFYGNKVTYLHGASDHNSRQLMAPYLLQWELIKQAKEQSYKYYDFFGIDALKWPGVTRFKLGFGGRVVSYAGTHDLVFKQRPYFLYNIMRKIRRFL